MIHHLTNHYTNNLENNNNYYICYIVEVIVITWFLFNVWLNITFIVPVKDVGKAAIYLSTNTHVSEMASETQIVIYTISPLLTTLPTAVVDLAEKVSVSLHE